MAARASGEVNWLKASRPALLKKPYKYMNIRTNTPPQINHFLLNGRTQKWMMPTAQNRVQTVLLRLP